MIISIIKLDKRDWQPINLLDENLLKFINLIKSMINMAGKLLHKYPFVNETLTIYNHIIFLIKNVIIEHI